MAQTVSFAIIGALILSLTYIPMMSALFLSKKPIQKNNISDKVMAYICLLYTSDVADERSSVDLGGRRFIKKKQK